MFRLVVTTLLAFAVAMVPDSQPADATAISTDLYHSQFCADCTPLMDYNTKPDLDRLISIETSTRDFTSCKSHEKIFCGNLEDNLLAEEDLEITKIIDALGGLETLNLEISDEYRNERQETSGCDYLETKLRDPRRVRQECDNVEPGANDPESFGVLTITTVSAISFALLAGVWLLLRSFRNWQLQNIIRRDKTPVNLQIRQSRRRSGRPIRG